MTRIELEQMKALKQEAKQLQEELDNLPFVPSSVKGSMTEFPYIEQNIKVFGVDKDKAARIKRKLELALDEIQDLILVMEDWLETVPDSEIRTILRLKYRNGYTQGQIGSELGFDRSVISRKLKVFWENQTCTQNTQ